MLAQPASLSPNTLFHGRYHIVRRISAGGMGAVYEVIDDKTKSARALKVMLPMLVEDPKLRERFALEAHVTGGIESDHLVRVLDAGVDDSTGIPFLVMDLLRGQDIGSMIKERGPLSPSGTVLFLRQAAFALDKAHAANIVHRDLKPENLFVTHRDDGSPCVKVLDFGIAKVLTPENTTKTTEALGTPLYMAPEQVRGHTGAGPWIDIYAMGHIAYTMLVGEAYFKDEKEQGSSIFEIFTSIVQGPSEAPCARALRRRGVRLPEAFDTWFAKATALNAGARFPSVSAEIAALSEVLGGEAALGGRPSSAPVPNPNVYAPNTAPPLAPTPAAHTPLYSQNTPSYSGTPMASANTVVPAKSGSGARVFLAGLIAAVLLVFTGLGLWLRGSGGEEKNMVQGQVSGATSNSLKDNTVSAALPSGAAPEGTAAQPSAPSAASAPRVADMTPEQRKTKRAELEAKYAAGGATLKDIKTLKMICSVLKDKKCAAKFTEEMRRRTSAESGEVEDVVEPDEDEEMSPHARPKALQKRPNGINDPWGAF